MFTLNKQSSTYYTIDTAKDTYGEIYRENDGFFVFSFTREHIEGLSQYFFSFVAYHLKCLNAELESSF